jgi:hypothetical protein
MQKDRSKVGPLRDHLVEAGFDVTCARTFLEAVPHLAGDRTDLLLVYLPETEWVRNALLNEVRRANPTLPIVAMAPAVGDELSGVQGVTELLPARGDWQRTLDGIRRALAARRSH